MIPPPIFQFSPCSDEHIAVWAMQMPSQTPSASSPNILYGFLKPCWSLLVMPGGSGSFSSLSFACDHNRSVSICHQPAGGSCSLAERWDTQDQCWRMKSTELCLSSPGGSSLVLTQGGSSWVGASVQPHFMGTCKVEALQSKHPGPCTSSCIQKQHIEMKNGPTSGTWVESLGVSSLTFGLGGSTSTSKAT